MAQDLSEIQHSITDLFIEAGRDFERWPFNDEQVEFYHEHGYLAGIKLLSDAQCDVLCEQLTELLDPNHDGRELWHEYHTNESKDPNMTLFHALGAWRIKPAFHDLVWNPCLTIPVSQLLEGAVRFWHDQLFCKPARHGGVVAWHQDYSYWTRTRPMAHLTCWIGLDRSTRDNGCLQYVPGSHRWKLLPITGLAGDMNAIRKVLTDEQWQQFLQPKMIELERGECSFHHPLMVHGSRENRTDKPRRAYVINYLRDGVWSETDQPLMQNIPVIPPGKRIEGQFFPLLGSHWIAGRTWQSDWFPRDLAAEAK